jgi:hypothetical protein
MIYSPAFQRVRLERIAFCKGECELAIHGRDVCQAYGLECHHKDKEAYERDRNGSITINDVICVCKHCHDFLTNQQRKERYSGRFHSVPTMPEANSEVRYGLAKARVPIVLERSATDEERTDRRSAKQIRKGIQGS